MIRIDPRKSSIVAPDYWELLKIFMKGKRKTSKLKAYAVKISGYKLQLRYVDKGIIDNSSIALGNPHDIINDYKKRYKSQTIKKGFVKRMENYYSEFIGTSIGELNPKHADKDMKIGTWLAKELGVKTCPYCNREYTFSHSLNNGREVHPEFDHFYPKSKYPYLALSFYNLVPSCHSCNHLKLNKEMDINPHFMSFEDLNTHFVIKDKRGNNYNAKVDHWVFDPKRIRVGFANSCKNVKVLSLDERYNLHTDYIADLIVKAQAYNSSFFDGLIESYKGLGKTEEDIYRLIWGTYQAPDDYGKRPFSKFTKDILDELGID